MQLNGNWSWRDGTLFLHGEIQKDGETIAYHISFMTHEPDAQWLCRDTTYGVVGRGANIEKAYSHWRAGLIILGSPIKIT